MTEEYLVDFPTLGDLLDKWIERHCRVPDGFRRGKPLELVDYQFWILANRYRIRENAEFVPPSEIGPDKPAVGNQAFQYRQTLVIGPQKLGKGPLAASFIAADACGPTLFADWAAPGDRYLCSENGCPCGWSYTYLPGEPKGMRHPSPLIQITGFSSDAADNIFRPLKSMIRLGPLRYLLLDRDSFVRVVGLVHTGEADLTDEELDRIDVVTASAKSRLGNPISSADQDEVGLWTTSNKMIALADTQRRGAAGMGGRTHGWTNMYDPTEASYAQQVHEDSRTADDIWVFYRDPDEVLLGPDGRPLDYSKKRNRDKIHRYVYDGAWWVNLASIEAEAANLMKRDPSQAARYFGNKKAEGKGSYLSKAILTPARTGREPGTEIALGFDGSLSGDWTVIRAEDRSGLRFTPTYTVGGEERPCWWDPALAPLGMIPRGEVHAALEQIFARYRVVRMYCDPREWETEIDTWTLTYGEDRVVKWYTTRTTPMHEALVRYRIDMIEGSSGHVRDELYEQHALNARMLAKPGDRFAIGKPSPDQHIDLCVADVLAHEAASDARADNWPTEIDTRVWCFGGPDDDDEIVSIRSQRR